MGLALQKMLKISAELLIFQILLLHLPSFVPVNGACLAKNAKNIGRITDISDFIATFALIITIDD